MPAGSQEPVLGIQEPAHRIEEPVPAIQLPAPAFQEASLKVAGRVVRPRWLLILGISAAMLIPCFWHKHFGAGDLGSTVYNAWLAELVQRGELSGLRIVPQWNNVAFDLLLSAFGKIVNWMWAERLAVSLCVLIFFWGLFSFIAAATRRAPFLLTPVIAMVTYGWTFLQGFINYYLALGLSFFALAILWRGSRKERLAVLPLVPLIFLAHPLGLIWLAGAGAYALVAEKFPRHRVLLFAAAILLTLSTSFFVRRHCLISRSTKPPYVYNGADQIVLYSRAYKLIAFILISFVLLALAREIKSRRNDPEIRGTGVVL